MKIRSSAAIRIIAAVYLVCAASCASFAQNFEGRTVERIEYLPAQQPIDPRDLANMQMVRPGQPLSITQVGATIDRLYASGLYDDIQADAEPSPAGVVIRFLTQ